MTYQVYKVSREHPNEEIKINSSATSACLNRLVLLAKYLLDDRNAYDPVVTFRNEEST